MRGRIKSLQISEDSSLLGSAIFPWREAKNQHSRRRKLHIYSVTSSLRNQSYQIYTLISLINQLKYCMGSCEALTKACTRQTQGSQMNLQNFCSEWFLPVIRLINVLVSICFVRNKLQQTVDVSAGCVFTVFLNGFWSSFVKLSGSIQINIVFDIVFAGRDLQIALLIHLWMEEAFIVREKWTC